MPNEYRTPCCADSSSAAPSDDAASPATSAVPEPSSPAPSLADAAAPEPSPAAGSASEPDDASPAPATASETPPVDAASPRPSNNVEPRAPANAKGAPSCADSSSAALPGIGVNETTSATESSTRRRALQIPTLFMEGTFQLRPRPAERKGMHTLYCKGWQGPTTRESAAEGNRQPGPSPSPPRRVNRGRRCVHV